MARQRTNADGTQDALVKAAGWAGGVNLRDAMNQLAPDEAISMENGILDERGAFTKRLGCTSKGTFGATPDRVLSMYTFYRTTNPPQILIHTSAGTLYYTNDPTANPIVWTQIVTGMSTTEPFSFETFANKVYMTNGVNDYASWDGSVRVAFTSAPKGRYIRLWKDTMWVAGVTNLEDRVFSSAAGNAESFPVASWVDVAKGDGDVMRALATDGFYLIVGKRNRGFIIFDPVTFANRVVDYEKGFESHFGVVQFESSIFFVSRRGFCEWLNDTPSRVISQKLDPLFDPNILNLGQLQKVWAYTYEQRVGWAIPEFGETRPSMQVEYYPRLAGVTPFGNRGTGAFSFQRIPASQFVKWRSGPSEFLYGGHINANKVLHVYDAVGTDEGKMFSGVVESGIYDFGAPTRTKYIRRMHCIGRGKFIMQLKRNFQTNIYKTFLMDLSSEIDKWRVLEGWSVLEGWGTRGIFREEHIHPDAYGQYFTIRITDSETDVGSRPIEVGSDSVNLVAGEWGIYGIVMDGKVLGVRDQ